MCKMPMDDDVMMGTHGDAKYFTMINSNLTMTVSYNNHTSHDIWLHNVIYHIRMCFLPIIFVGTVTNILNFMVLSKREMYCLSTSVYLCALAVADLGVMYVELFRIWFEWTDIIRPELYFTDIYCKIVNYSNGVIRDFSNWLIACLAFERVVMVACPYTAKSMCTVKTAKKVTLSLFAIICVPHCVYLAYSTAQYRTYWVCWEDPAEPVGSLLVAIVELLIGYTVVLVVFILNILLTILLYKKDIPCIGSTRHGKSQSNRVSNNRRLTQTLISIAVVSIVGETPRIILSCICRFLERTAQRRIILNISYVLSGINHASNFFIYICASPRFKLIFYQIIPWKNNSVSFCPKDCVPLRRYSASDSLIMERETCDHHGIMPIQDIEQKDEELNVQQPLYMKSETHHKQTFYCESII